MHESRLVVVVVGLSVEGAAPGRRRAGRAVSIRLVAWRGEGKRREREVRWHRGRRRAVSSKHGRGRAWAPSKGRAVEGGRAPGADFELGRGSIGGRNLVSKFRTLQDVVVRVGLRAGVERRRNSVGDLLCVRS